MSLRHILRRVRFLYSDGTWNDEIVYVPIPRKSNLQRGIKNMLANPHYNRAVMALDAGRPDHRTVTVTGSGYVGHMASLPNRVRRTRSYQRQLA
jgi:hypothetical protein